MGQRDNAPVRSAGLDLSGNPAAQSGIFVLNGEYWTIGHGGVNFSLKNVLGLSYIHRLLQHPAEDFHALDLLMGPGPSTTLETGNLRTAPLRNDADLIPGRPGDEGPLLDAQAKQEYRRRILELKEELDELREKGDHQRGTKVESEIEFLTRELARAFGLGGRSRRAGSAAERARLNVTRAIRAAIQKISEHHDSLGELLGASIRTGSYCSYIPNSRVPIIWKFTLESGGLSANAAAPAPLLPLGITSLFQTPADRTAFVGREEERAVLRSCLEQAKSGEGRVVIIVGPPGIGKTRTSREAGEEARQRGFLALAGSCYDREGAVPFIPFVELLEVALKRLPGPAAVREVLGDQAAELARLLPQLRRLFQDLPPPLHVSPEQSRRLLFDAVVELIARQSALNPMLLLLEDLHWADEGTLALLVRLGRSVSRMPVMIIATHRNDDIDLKPPLIKALDELTRLRVVERIQLQGLPQSAVAQMIEALSRREPSPALVDLVYSNTDGNPLFVEELIRHLDQSHPNGDFLERLEQGEIDLPQSLRLAIGRRLGLVSKDTVRILGTAAMIGRSFAFALLEASTRSDPDRLIDWLEEAESAGLISSKLQYPEASFKFAHELIRRAVADELSAARRQRLHLNIAEAIELRYRGALEDHAEDLAHHFWSAGVSADTAKAIRYLQMAGEKAVHSSANVAAIGHFRKALQLIATLPETTERLQQELLLEMSLGAALIATKGFSTRDVVGVYARARELSQRVGEAAQLFRVLWGQWVNCAVRAEHRAALELGHECLRVAHTAADRVLLVEAHHALGVEYCTAGEFIKGLEHLEQAITLYDPERHGSHTYTYGQDPAVVCLIHSGFALWFLGYPERTLKRNDEALALARKLSHPASLATAAAFAAQLQQLCRNPQAVEELAGIAVDLSTQRDFAFSKAMGIVLGGWALTQLKQKEAGIGRMRAGLEVLRATDAVAMTAYFSALLAEAYGEAGQPQEGLSVLAGADSAGDRYWAAELYRVKGELMLSRADAHTPQHDGQGEAEGCFRQALTIARAQNAKSLELRAAMSLCRLLLRQGKRSAARLALEEIYGWFTEGLNTPDLRDAKLLLDKVRTR